MSHLENPEVRKAGLVIIGNEILSGRTQDTNTLWIAERVVGRGIMLGEVRVVPDIEDKIIRAVNELRAEFDYVFTTGGIGPTHDDITAASIAKAFDVPLEVNDEAFKILEQHYGTEELTPARAKMAQIPKGASLIENPVSAAPGFIIENVYVMAGIPRIMQAMLENILRDMEAGTAILSNTVTCSLTESVIAEALGALQGRYSTVDIGSYPNFRGGSLGLALVLRSMHEEDLKKATSELIGIIRAHGDEPGAMSLQVEIEEIVRA